MPTMNESWKADLEEWLAPFVSALGHKVRARLCPLYVAGLIGLGDRKSIQPMAAREGGVGYDQLHHVVAAGTWDQAPLEDVLLKEADRMVGGQAAFLIIDDTALPKKGKHSVGVAPQYATTLGKNANCQTLVSITLARDEVPAMVGLRLFLPQSWTSDPDRLIRARVPGEHQTYKTKPEIALEEIDRILTAGVHFGCVLADAGYGLSAPFRQGLSAWPHLGGGGGRAPEGLSRRRGPDLPGGGARPAAQEPRARRDLALGGEDAGERPLAHAELEAGDQGPAQGPLCRRADPCGGWAAPEDRRHGTAASAGGRGLAHWRAPVHWRAEILSLQPSRRYASQAPGRRGGPASRRTSN
jgi:SRSO17 transposase